MKILRLTAENIKRLRAVEITPDGHMVQITGANGAGKTSVLDAIWWALAGASHIQAAPIRDGEDEARIRLDLGEIVVTRTFRRVEGDAEPITALTVQNAEGGKYPSPQRMLDELLGALTFDPLVFERQSAKEQFTTLRQFVPGVDFEGIDYANRLDFATRTNVNRDARALRVRAEAIVVPEVLPEGGDEHELMHELERALASNADADLAKQRYESEGIGIQRLKAEAAALREQAERLEAEAVTRIAGLLPPPIERVDVTAIRRKMEAAHAVTNALADRKERDRLVGEAEALEARSAELTSIMEGREQQKRDAILAAQMPVPELSLGTDLVLLRGVPFEQASDAERLRASVAIAMAANPKLRVLRIRDGSLLDSKSLALVAAMAAELDYQVWIERVEESGQVGFVIEDGQLKERQQ